MGENVAAMNDDTNATVLPDAAAFGDRLVAAARALSSLTLAQAALQYGVGITSLQAAKFVLAYGAPELARAMEVGLVPAAEARRIAYNARSHEDQQRIVAERQARADNPDAVAAQTRERRKVYKRTHRRALIARPSSAPHAAASAAHKQAAYRKLQELCSAFDGYVAVLPRLDVRAALGEARNGEAEHFASSIEAIIIAVRELGRRVFAERVAHVMQETVTTPGGPE